MQPRKQILLGITTRKPKTPYDCDSEHLAMMALILAFDQVAGERFERSGGFAEGLEGGEGIGDEFFGVFEGFFNAEDGRPGGLDAGGILACGLAQFFGALGHVEDVVDDLEGEPGFFAEGAEAGDGVGGRCVVLFQRNLERVELSFGGVSHFVASAACASTETHRAAHLADAEEAA